MAGIVLSTSSAHTILAISAKMISAEPGDNRREIEAEDLPNQTAPLPGSLAQEPRTYARLIPTWRSDYEA